MMNSVAHWVNHDAIMIPFTALGDEGLIGDGLMEIHPDSGQWTPWADWLEASGMSRPALTAAIDPLASVPNAEGVDEPVDTEDATDTADDTKPYEDASGNPTGAMIALVPSEVDLDRLVIDGGEPREELHLTLFYLGDAADTNSATQAATTFAIGEVVQLQQAIEVTGFGAALWNPLGANPAIVLNVGGEILEDVRETIEDVLETVWDVEVPEQHSPWVPHVCLAYSGDEGLVSQALQRVGEITFDRVRVAWGSSVTDFPLYASPIAAEPLDDTGVAVTASTSVRLATDSPPASGMMPGDKMGMSTQGPPGSWEGILVVEGVETGDGREFAINSLDNPAPPLPLAWAKSNLGEHQGSVVVARIDQVWRDPANPSIIRGSGMFDLATAEGQEAYGLVQRGFLKGVSVDVDSVKDADVEYVYAPTEGDDEMSDDETLMDIFAMPDKMIFHKGRVRGATLVALPAFVEAQIQLTDGTMQLDTTSAAPSGDGATGYALSLFSHNCGDSPDIGACAVGVGKLLTDSTLGIDLTQRAAIYAHLRGHLETAGLTPQAFGPESFSDEVAALVAGGSTALDYPAPPAAFFERPAFTEYTPLTIADDGREIYGHAAEWQSCHTSFEDMCVAPPREGEHVYYRLGEVLTAEGSRVAVGNITLGTGHAPTFGVDPRKAVEHYDNTGVVVADVTSGEDEFGIWVHGAIRPGVSAARIAELRGAKLSGDWRRIGGALRLVAMLAVNVPGFGVPRLRAGMHNGRQLSLVAAGIPSSRALANAAIREVAAGLARRIGRDPTTRLAELRARVHKN